MEKKLAVFVEGIQSSGLLDASQVGVITSWASAPNADPQVVAKEIVGRGWLTAFQVKMFWKGRGNELILNQYVLMDRLGEGGMGEVYRAKHRRMDRDVALKVIRRERLNSVDAIKRFGREIQAAAQLAHENIVMAYDADQAGDRHFFAMEYVEGTNLSKLVKDKGPLPISQACDCIRQAANGLQHAFERGMVHRDIKPSNLLLGKTGVLKILDMGLARLLETPDGEQESRITQEGLVVGTPDFLAPEQARNARNADIRSDLYALGCTFYSILCGHTPYQGSTPTEKMLRHTTDPIPPLTRQDVPMVIAGVINKMMAKKPEDRFQTPAEVVHALQSLTGTGPIPSLGTSSRHVPLIEPLKPAVTPAHRPVVQEPRTESQFRLPAPPKNWKPPRERTRWNLPIALFIVLLILGLAAGGIYYALKSSGALP
ncbi:MAG: serine/threonine protein kinase [Planctomycetes bacterium]|nr:serine/threonine protein kinase [Planctomycetota bacterium]